jgi:alpha-L-rhamnosidase
MTMKKILYICISVAVFFSACNSESKISVSGLQCEYLTDPLGIETETPRFSWKIIDNTNTRGIRQTAYRILVASAPDKLKSNKPDVWDSEIVYSEQSHLVPYCGTKLLSGTAYYWKVIVYTSSPVLSTKDANAAELSVQEANVLALSTIEDNPATSAVARFSIGLLNRSDWKGDWIKHPTASPEKQIWFRKTLTIADKASSAFAYVATNGYHEFYVNGHKVDDRVLAPAISRIDKRILYVTYDIAPLLRKGDNIIALWYGPGWSLNDYFAPLVVPAALLQLDGQTKNGESFGLYSDESWKCAESYSSNSRHFQFMDMGGEKVDGRRYSTDWNTVNFDDSKWVNTTKVNPLKKGGELVLSAQMTDPSRIIATIPAQKIDTFSGTWRVDLGKSITGFVEAHFDGLKDGDTVLIQISNRPNVVEEHRQRQYYFARGENGEFFRNRFNFFGGRYVHFTGLKQAPKLGDVTGYAVSSAAPRTGYFECSDEMFNRMYEVDRWTYEMCNTDGVTVDCPNRERLGYGPEGAYQTTWGLGLPCFSSGAYYMKNIRDWSDVQSSDGSINNVAPQISRMYGSALNGAANMNIALEHYLAYGDKKILEDVYETGKKWLGFLNNYVSDGLLTPYDRGGYFLGEWVSPGPIFEYGDTPQALFSNNCVYAMTLDFFIRISEALNRGDEMPPYREKLAILRTKIHEKYFDPAINSYLTGDQVRTAFAIFAGVVPDSLNQLVVKHLENDMTGEHPYFNIGSFTRYQYFHVLFAYPQFQEIIAGILSKTTYPGYGNFLEHGQTTWPETWEIDHPNSAIIHTSYAGISSWFIKSLAGIEPDNEDPGYHTVTIRPHTVEKLTYAKAGLESPYGLIESGWRKENGKVVYEISVPVGSKAKIYLPAKLSEIKENGLPVTQIEGVKTVEEKDEYSLILTESGKYRFELIRN